MHDRTGLAGRLAVVIIVAVLTGCGDGGDEVVAEGPPWCLADMELPDDADAIETVLAGMPDEHNGAQRELVVGAERIEVLYDEPLEGTPSVQAFNVDALARAFPESEELTGFEVMEILIEAGSEPVDPGGVTGELDEISMDPDADLLWVTGDTVEVGATSAEDVRAPSLTFAHPEGRWIFTITAATTELRVDLVNAFCDAAGS